MKQLEKKSLFLTWTYFNIFPLDDTRVRFSFHQPSFQSHVVACCVVLCVINERFVGWNSGVDALVASCVV